MLELMDELKIRFAKDWGSLKRNSDERASMSKSGL
jgi:hypothetical protein